MHLIAGFALTQSICYLDVIDMWLKFALMETKEPIPTLSDEPHIPKAGKHFANYHSGNENQCCALLRVIGSVAGHFCTTTKVKMLYFATRKFGVSYFVLGVLPHT